MLSRSKFILLFISFIFLVLFSCTSAPDKDECEELSMKKYKGIPTASNRFDKFCQNISIKYTEKLCQKALIEFMMNGDVTSLKEKYGDKIIHCFTQDDLNRFNLK